MKPTLKELINSRDKLQRYDELVEWRDKFAIDENLNPIHACLNMVPLNSIPANIKQIILGALEAEIKKMEEE